MGNYLDTPNKKYACAAGVVAVAGLSFLYISRKRGDQTQQPQERNSKYMEILNRDALATILKQIRKAYSDKFIETRKSHRTKRRSLESTDLDLYKRLVMRYNASIAPIFEEVRDRILAAQGVDCDLLQDSINFYEGKDPEIAKLASTASVAFNTG